MADTVTATVTGAPRGSLAEVLDRLPGSRYIGEEGDGSGAFRIIWRGELYLVQYDEAGPIWCIGRLVDGRYLSVPALAEVLNAPHQGARLAAATRALAATVAWAPAPQPDISVALAPDVRCWRIQAGTTVGQDWLQGRGLRARCDVLPGFGRSLVQGAAASGLVVRRAPEVAVH